MKLTFLLAFVGIFQVSAKIMAQTVTYSGQSVPLTKVFAAIEKQTGYVFFYEQADIKNTKPVSVIFKNTPLTSALEKIFADQSLEFELQGHTIFINKKAPKIKTTGSLPAEVLPPGEVRGIVMDEKMVPIPGITVYLKSNRFVQITDEKGVFVFQNVREQDSLVFSSVNYENKTVAAVQGTVIKVMLKIKNMQLEEVKVYNTGYQILSKERATGSYSKPDMEVINHRGGTMDLISRMEGLVPGLVLTFGERSTGANFTGNGVATRNSTVRGIATIATSQNSSPLLVLNGVIVPDLATLNLDDVEDITVLKDAAALAIYGAQSANGVIVVTTKTGSKQRKVTINYSGYVNFRGKPDFKYVPVLTSPQFIQAAKETFDPNANYYSQYLYNIAPHESILYNLNSGKINQMQANKSLDSLGSINNFAQIKDLFYRTAFTNNHTVSASGGGNLYSFYASLGYTQEHNNTPGSANNSYRFNLTQSFNPSDRVKISLNTSLQNTVTKSNNAVNISNTYLPYQLFLDAQGNQVNMPFMAGYEESLRLSYQQRSGINLDYYPLKELNYVQNTSNLLAANVTANTTVQLVKGLSFQGTYGYQRLPGYSTIFADNRSLPQRKNLLGFTSPAATTGGSPTYYLPVTGGDYTTNNTNEQSWTVRNQLVYQAMPFKGRDNLTLQAGQEVRELYNYRTSTTVLGYDQLLGTFARVDYNTLNKTGVPGGNIIGSVSLLANPFSISKTTARFNSYFGLGSYTYNNEFSLDASIRRDQSNLFGSDISAQAKPFWSVGGKWKITHEAFMKPLTWVNELSLRATYGVTGNSPYVGAASQNDVLQATSDGYGQIAGGAFVIGTTANRLLEWESTHNINLGINFVVLHNRISGSIDYYHRNSTGLLGTTPVNPLTGFVVILGNVGEITNQGVEIALATDNIRGKDFGWTSNFTLAYNKNKIISITKPNLYSNLATYNAGSSVVPGLPMQALFAYRYAGLDNLGDPQVILHDGSITKVYDAAKAADLKYMGTTVPVFSGGFSNTFRYKSISLTGNVVYSLGNVMRRDVNTVYTGRLTNSGFRGANVPPSFMDRWKQPGDEKFTDIPSFVAGAKTNFIRRNTDYYRLADINVVSASYVKLRDITLSYSFSSRVTKALGIQAINVYGQTSNFMIWKNNKYNIDPEYQALNSGIRNIPPFTHGYTLGLNVTL
jgi:TonB-linked SusC/RagA family outer membrane protein